MFNNIKNNSQFTSFQLTHGAIPVFGDDRFGYGASPELMRYSRRITTVAEFLKDLAADNEIDSESYVFIGDEDGTAMSCTSFAVYATAATYPWSHKQTGVMALPGKSVWDAI